MGYSDFVELQLTVKEAGQVQAWLEAKKGPEQMGDAMDKMGRKGKQSSDTLAGAMDSMIGKWASVQGAIGLAQKALDFYMEANKKAIQEGKAATQIVDESIRKLRVQSSSGMDQAQLTQMIGKSAVNAAVSLPFATSAAQQAISSGFKDTDILKNGGLDSILQFANATNSTDQDPAEMVKSLGLFLGATGQDLNSENLRRTMRGTQRLFKGTNMQASALRFMAKEGSQISQFGGLSGDDTLAISSVLLNTLKEEQAATSFRAGISDLSGAGNEKKKKDALAKFGLKPADVDMVGESFMEVMERIDQGGKDLKPEERNLALQSLFSQEARAAMMPLLSEEGRAKVRSNRALMNDEQGFIADAEIYSTGSAAEMRRNETAETLADYASGLGETAIAIDSARVASKGRRQAPVTTAAKESVSQAVAGLGVEGGVAAGFGDAFIAGLFGGGLTSQYKNQTIEIKLIDEDNRAIPHEQRGKGVEDMSR